MASWYGGKFQGRKTANGEVFDTNKMTAAHKTLPFDTVVKVTNLKNNKSVLVRINDRGPFVEGRVIDLSRAAAEIIDMTISGVTLVELDIVSLPDGFSESALINSESVHPEGIPESYKIQIASFSSPDNAQSCLQKVKNADISAEIEIASSGMLRIIVPEVKREDVERLQDLLGKIGFKSTLIRHN
ncbi:MAG TPA: septal ring lytic transglycosylase RlpA family lipoprotein [Spirochaeta sp.]|nr:septal ring lytic transglycosylase RlpA family lipoprotein [Spirochaeta sp.]